MYASPSVLRVSANARGSRWRAPDSADEASPGITPNAAARASASTAITVRYGSKSPPDHQPQPPSGSCVLARR